MYAIGWLYFILAIWKTFAVITRKISGRLFCELFGSTCKYTEQNTEFCSMLNRLEMIFKGVGSAGISIAHRRARVVI